jgi:UDP-N-acetylmuramoyl-tripeptide--D-alanyl-D-alanine ligase
VHNGLEVLAEVDARLRILVTPGLVELGAVEDAENRRYGEHAARVCDHVIVMDARPGRALREGLRAGGMADDHVHVVRTLAEATAVIGRIAGAGDAVLFANDLPDTYLGAA